MISKTKYYFMKSGNNFECFSAAVPAELIVLDNFEIEAFEWEKQRCCIRNEFHDRKPPVCSNVCFVSIFKF